MAKVISKCLVNSNPFCLVNSQSVSFLHDLRSRSTVIAFHASPTDPSQRIKNNAENRVRNASLSASLFHSGRVAVYCSVNRWYFFSVDPRNQVSPFLRKKSKRERTGEFDAGKYPLVDASPPAIVRSLNVSRDINS